MNRRLRRLATGLTAVAASAALLTGCASNVADRAADGDNDALVVLEDGATEKDAREIEQVVEHFFANRNTFAQAKHVTKKELETTGEEIGIDRIANCEPDRTEGDTEVRFADPMRAAVTGVEVRGTEDGAEAIATFTLHTSARDFEQIFTPDSKDPDVDPEDYSAANQRIFLGKEDGVWRLAGPFSVAALIVTHCIEVDD